MRSRLVLRAGGRPTVFLSALWGFGSVAAAQSVLVPGAAASSGGSAFSALLSGGERSYQVAIGQQELNGRLPVGARITGVRWRVASFTGTPSWPPAPATFEHFDVFLARCTVTPGSLSVEDPMSNLGSDAVQVRGGPITFEAGSFPGGAVTPAFNALGVPITFSGAYTYQGGPLLLMVRHTGWGGVPNGNLDWVASAFGGSGMQAIGTTSYSSNTGWGGGGNGGATAIQFTFEPPVSCYANCDNSTTEPVLNVLDFNCFLNRFSAGAGYANCDGSTTEPVLNVLDFNCFLNRFSAGCP